LLLDIDKARPSVTSISVHLHIENTTAYRNLAGKGHFKMEDHCQQLAQNYESIAAGNAALATGHRQLAQEAAQKK
jgi:hypothetical protein